jgi:hypothetical protein
MHEECQPQLEEQLVKPGKTGRKLSREEKVTGVPGEIFLLQICPGQRKEETRQSVDTRSEEI